VLPERLDEVQRSGPGGVVLSHTEVVKNLNEKLRVMERLWESLEHELREGVEVDAVVGDDSILTLAVAHLEDLHGRFSRGNGSCDGAATTASRCARLRVPRFLLLRLPHSRATLALNLLEAFVPRFRVVLATTPRATTTATITTTTKPQSQPQSISEYNRSYYNARLI